MTKISKPQSPPVAPDSRMNKLIALSLDQVEAELQSKRATSQTLQFFLKLADTKAALELEKIKLENNLLEAKIEAERSANKVEEMIEEVLSALKSYSFDPADEYYD